VNLRRLKKDLRRHEGFVPTVYEDSVGVPTIGYGRNLKDVGITDAEAEVLLENDIRAAAENAHVAVSNFGLLTDVRREVVVNMIFNLGLTRFRKFHLFLGALAEEDWERAADEMLDSRWAQQVGQRAQELAAAMRHG
jgi:lysozyme